MSTEKVLNQKNQFRQRGPNRQKLHALTVDITAELQFSSQQKPYVTAMRDVDGCIDNTSEPEREAVSGLIAEAFEPLLAYVETQNLRAANNDNF